MHNIQRRWSRKSGGEESFHTAAYSYKVRVHEDNMQDVAMCFKAFNSLHGITKGKVEYLKKS